MKRAEALKGLSREHQEALVLARRACANETDPHGADARAQCAHLLECWPRFAAHFALEEQTLLPALERAGQGASAALALRQHAELRALVERIRQGDLLALAPWGMGTDYYPRLTATIHDPVATNRLVNEQTEVALLLAGPVLLAMLALAPWGMAMNEHVRFEERTLFPMAEAVIEPSKLIEVMNRSAH